MTVEQIVQQIHRRLETVHTGCFQGMSDPLLLISEEYPGVWLEHVYDAVFYARLDPTKLYLAENTVRLFLHHQTSEGQLPCFVLDGKRPRSSIPTETPIGYSQLQECVSFARLCYEVYKMNQSTDFLQEVYHGCCAWAKWLWKYRTTSGRGLIEMFVGYDTGHDNSGRLAGLCCHGNYQKDGVRQNASILPPCDAAPILAVDINCNYYGTLTTLSKMASDLSLTEDAATWRRRAAQLKENILSQLYDGQDAFFYDVDKNGKMRKYRSSTIFHLFLEEVLDPTDDKALIDRIVKEHVLNPEEFFTPYPFPSMAVNDPSCIGHPTFNCWGYYTQGLIALRTTLWMEKYGLNDALSKVCESWIDAWTRCFEHTKMGQELDPTTGEPTACSEWYSATMLFYLYAAKRLGYTR